MRVKQSKETERAFSRPSFLLFDSEWFFNRSRRSSYMNSYYLFLLLVWVATFSGKLKGKVSTFSVENSLEDDRRGQLLQDSSVVGGADCARPAARSRPSNRQRVSRPDHGIRLLAFYLTDTKHGIRHVPCYWTVRSRRPFVPDRTLPVSDPNGSSTHPSAWLFLLLGFHSKSGPDQKHK